MDLLTEQLNTRGRVALSLHGDTDHEAHKLIVNDFLNGSFGVIITTDNILPVVDLQQPPLIINYDIPKEREQYIKRTHICKSDLKHETRIVINFIKNEDVTMMRDIEQFYNTQMEEMPMNGFDLM